MSATDDRLLILVRHAKSDWDVPADDHERPLADRGRRQAPAIGTWLAEHAAALPVERAVVSTATRARQTWELAAEALTADGVAAPPVRFDEEVYTFFADPLRAVIAALDPGVRVAVVVGHNPALADLLNALTDGRTTSSMPTPSMPTSSIAVVALTEWSAPHGRLLAAGRPADGGVELTPLR